MRKYLRENVFIIKRGEWHKFIPLFLIGSFVIFNFIMLRQLKDSLLMSSLGASAIATAKIYYVFPASILFMFMYSKLSNYLDGKVIFMIFVSLFGVFFLSYSLFLHNIELDILKYLFYTLAESWSTVVFGTCMWAFFNDVCTIDEAKRFYVLISGAQIGSFIASGSANWFVKTFKDNFFIAALLSVVFCCLGIVFTIFMFKDSLKNIRKKVEPKKSEYKGIFKGILLLFRSRYLFLILVITLSYNFTIVVTEFIWKSNVAAVYATKEQLFVYIGNVSFWTTTVASLFSIFLTGGLMRYIGLTAALVLFPAAFGIATSYYFFLFMTPLGGAVQWIVTKILKYSLADPAKQMLYIPCEEEERYKGKSVIDIVGARGGKALGSVFAKTMLAPLLYFQDMAYYSYPFLIIITILWLLSAVNAGIIFSGYKNR